MFRKNSIIIFLLFCCGNVFSQAVGDYQSAASGNWNALATWQTWNGASWVAAGATPTSANGVITIQAGHVVNITAAVTVDQVIVNGSVNLKNVALTIANGAGDDLVINGCFEDSSNTAVAWNAGAQWSIAPGATLIRCSSSAVAAWQNNYSGGISTIPSTANWINRKSGTGSPLIVTIGAYYPNLTIENKTGANWVTATTSTFQGTTGYPTIKGNFDIGGTGSNTVDFLNGHTFATPTLVLGNVTVRTGNTLRNFGTGIEIQGDLTVNGTVNYSGGAGTRKIIFSGGNAQNISGAGTLNIYDITFNKSSNGVTLNRAITVDNLSTFTSGIVYSSAANLYNVNTNGSVAGANNSSFVNGPVRYVGNAAFTFPVGKNADYQALSYSATPGGGTFWTEPFSNACGANCLANGWTGTNGTWVTTATGANSGTCNIWYISCAEDGCNAGGCGVGCGGNAGCPANDPSLHMGSQSLGDIGAAYDAGGVCGFFYCVTTNWRAESPTINCTGQSTISLNFNYIENGQGATDNATVWYYDGTSWAQIDDPPKSTLCGGQGLWAARSIVLPASANNNPNVKIGFNWTNNDDGLGNDPSFAVDDITLSTAGPLCDFTCEYFYANPQVVYNNNLAPTLNSISGCEYWVLTRNAGTANKILTLTWDGNSCPAIPQVSDTRVAHFDQTTTQIWQDEGNGGNTGTTAAGTVTSAAPVTYFSPFTIALIPPVVLPIDLLGFSGTCSGNTVLLNWSTASEKDNDYFTIERSTDGTHFISIGRVNGAGNSSQQLNYSFTDPDPVQGINYYRLKQTDINGHSVNVKIISVNASNCSANPFAFANAWFDENSLVLNYSNGKSPVTAEIYSSDGKRVQRFETLPQTAIYTLDATGWSDGIYFVRITDGFSSLSRTVVKK